MPSLHPSLLMLNPPEATAAYCRATSCQNWNFGEHVSYTVKQMLDNLSVLYTIITVIAFVDMRILESLRHKRAKSAISHPT